MVCICKEHDTFEQAGFALGGTTVASFNMGPPNIHRDSVSAGREPTAELVTVRRVRRRTTRQRAAAGEGEDEGVDVGVDAVGEQGEVRRRGAPLAGTADSSPVETPSGSPTTSCGRV